METTKLSDTQRTILEMAKWFHSFCDEHNLCYYIIGGTLLGARRHSGFIPWDDDIDIGMPRPDFERLLDLGEKLTGRYLFESYRNRKPDFIYTFGKLYDTNTTLIENQRTPVKRGLYLDIFPIDGIGNSRDDAKRNFKPIRRRIQILSAKACGISKRRSYWKNLAIKLAWLIPGSITSEIEKIVELSKSRDYEKCDYVGNLSGNWFERELVPKKFFGTPKLYNFEDTKLFGCECSDEYLTYVYGEWRKLPPPEKQVSHHDYLFKDLKKGYLEV